MQRHRWWLGWEPQLLRRAIVSLATSKADGSFTRDATFVGGFGGWAAIPGVRVTDGDFNADGKSGIGVGSAGTNEVRQLAGESSGWSCAP